MEELTPISKMKEDVNIEELEESLAEKERKILELEKKVEDLNSNIEHLKSRTHTYREIIHSSPSMITLLRGEDLIIEMANKRVLEFWQKSRSVIGKPLLEVHPDIREQGLEELLLNVLSTGEPEYGYEMPIHITRGEEKQLAYFNFIYQPQSNSEGKVTGVAVIAQEVTPKAVFHQKIRESEYKYRELIHSSNSLITILRGENMEIEIANDAIKKIWGKGNDVEGSPLFEILPEMIGQGMPEIFKEVYETGQPYFAQERPLIHVQNGQTKLGYFDFVYQPQTNIEGEIDGVAVIAHDVTKQGLLNKKIRESEKELRELVNFMPHKVSMSDAEGVPIYYNNSWITYTGKEIEELLQNSWHKLIHPEDRDSTELIVEKSIETGTEFELELRIFDIEGNAKWHLARVSPIKNEEGEITSWISSCTEIQKIKEEEERKEGFLKLVSHELKTPVTSIKGYIQLLLTLLETEREIEKNKIPIKPYLNRIETQVERLIRLISEMLDLSRIEQNEMELKKEKFDLNEHVENIIEDITYTHKEAQIDLSHYCKCEVIADKDRIGQVIINFITNALKYSPEGNKVDVKVFEQGERVAVSVKDYGIGIEQKEIRKIFNRFYRVSSKSEGTYSGFGIGLYLSDEIINRHNGTIHVDSEPGKGSEFTFTIPINQN